MIQFRPDDTADVTELLQRWRRGDPGAAGAVLRHTYAELRRVAGHLMNQEAVRHTLQPTALVHEAYLRLVGGARVPAANRRELVGILARLMRQVLCNHARDRTAQKRGGERSRVPLDAALAVFAERSIDLLALDEALDALGALDARKCRIVELRFFGGLSNAEVADLLDVSIATVERDWAMARAWLRARIDDA